MIISLRRLRQLLLFAGLFVLLTLLISKFSSLFVTLFPLRSPYQEPYGNAVKVFVHQADDQVYISAKEIAERIRLFYWTGE